MTRSPFGPKTAIAAEPGDLFLVTRGAGESLEIEKLDPRTAATGADGDFYIDTSAWTIYGPKASGAWGSATSLIGPQGATGTTGAAGADGRTVLLGDGAPASGLGV